MNNKIYVDQYIMYGLNRRRNFIGLPECDTCGERMGILLETAEDIEDFAVEALRDHDCNTCALFFVFNDDSYGAYFKCVYDEDEKDVEYALCRMFGKDRHMFAELDGEFRFCCYSLLVETNDGLFEVCT